MLLPTWTLVLAYTQREFLFIQIIWPLFMQGGPTDVFTLFCIGNLCEVLHKSKNWSK